MEDIQKTPNTQENSENPDIQDLLPFLKKYSDVDVGFIQQFITIQKGDNLHSPFKIDLDIVAKWLKTEKGKLKNTLEKSYTINIDYILLAANSKQTTRGGHNKETILLTPDTFKMLTMKSKTQDAQKVRYYYVTLEKLVEIYKDDIIKNQNKKIEKLERNLKKIKYPVEGAIYLMKVSDEEDEFKIGITKDMNKRIKAYNTAHKDDPEVAFIFYTHDTRRLEKCVKNALKYREYRNNKEFYKASKKEIIEAIEDCDALISKFVNNDKKNSRSTSQDEEIIFAIKVVYDDDEDDDDDDDDDDFEKNLNQSGGYNENMKTKYLSNKFDYIELINTINTNRLNQEQSHIDNSLNLNKNYNNDVSDGSQNCQYLKEIENLKHLSSINK